MPIHWIDGIIIALFLFFSFWISYRSRAAAGKGLRGFFLGGGNMPWYLAGISMVATTFAADTPLAVTELIASDGIAGNWIWWNFLIGGVLTTVFFARLWRRSGVLTEVEFIHLRYDGWSARFLRGFKSVYLGLFINAMIIGWVNLAFMSILEIFLEVDPMQAFWISAAIMAVVAVYSAISGLKGIVLTDAFQFTVAMIGCIILAVIVLQSPQIGGVEGLKQKLPEGSLSFFPDIDLKNATDSESMQAAVGNGVKTFGLTISSFLAYIGLLWWTSWYPGQEPGGGGYIAQRMLSAKDEGSAVKATLLFQVAHYCLRPWPWIIVGLCSVVLYPGLEHTRFGFVMAIRDFMPVGLTGLLLVAFLGAYMSTISTQINWGASYIVNDLVLPYQKSRGKELGERQQVTLSRITTGVIMLIGLAVSTQIESVKGVWEFILQCGAGIGVVLIFRWFWWRINAWAEVAATVTPFLVYLAIQYMKSGYFQQYDLASNEVPDIWYFDMGYGVMLSVGITTVVWMLVMWLTKPVGESRLSSFFSQVKPMGWWGKTGRADNSLVGWLILAWLAGVVMVYSCLFFVGKWIFYGLFSDALLYLIAMVAGLLVFIYAARKGRIFTLA